MGALTAGTAHCLVSLPMLSPDPEISLKFLESISSPVNGQRPARLFPCLSLGGCLLPPLPPFFFLPQPKSRNTRRALGKSTQEGFVLERKH